MTAVKRIKYPSHYLENIWNEKRKKKKEIPITFNSKL